MRGQVLGSLSLGRPFRPRRLASRWTLIQMPTKYSSAGMTATTMSCRYGTPTVSLMRKAALPMTGGMIWPPVEAAASTAPANSGS